MSPCSHSAASLAAGGLVKGVDLVMKGQLDTIFALVRPPGHHATTSTAMGFCLFNNIAIAANEARRKYGVERILIADFDVHHGNGTQEAFYQDPGVLYFSVHQYPLYPGTGSVTEIGAGPGVGYTVNVPLPPWSGDREYIRAFEEVLVPLARRFRPQLILSSAGYDAHWADDMSFMQLSAGDFGRITSILRQLADDLCDGRLVLALEGGYHLQALASSVEATLSVLLGERPPQTR
jgi:acetoin utilization deacetylase AcuC-like enzyme